MDIKKRIRESWQHPELPNTCTKKDELEFRTKKNIKISLRTYIYSLASLVLIFSLTFAFVFENNYKQDNNGSIQNQKIEFGSLDPNDLSIKTSELSKININHKSYFNVRGNFTLWFNSLKVSKADIDYNKININDYIANLKPVNICVSNENYAFYFTEKDYLVVCYEQIYIMYELENADKLLQSFVSSF